MVIVSSGNLSQIPSSVTMVDGSFDPLHDGHVLYFERASELGHPVLCNIAPDSYTLTKHRILLPRESRARLIDAIRFISFVLLEDCSTAAVLDLVRPRVYAKGSDWRERGGIPFDESQVCMKLGIKVVYLETVRNSSTKLLDAFDNDEHD